MPIDISEYANPRWVRMRTRYPWTTEQNYPYRNLTINPRTPVQRYNTDLVNVRDDGWKAPGYNVNHNSITIERVNTGVDTTNRQFRPY
jgi:hypothetical protein